MSGTERTSLWDQLRHAFAVKGSAANPPTVKQLELVERLCSAIVKRRLTPAASALFEMVRPLNYLGAQSLHFLEPVATTIFSRDEYREFTLFLERRDAMDLITDRLDALQAGNAADN